MSHHSYLCRSLVSCSTGMFLCLSGAAIASGQNLTCGITELPSASVRIYPAIAQAAHVSGKVVLLATFDQDGAAKVTRFISGPDMLRDASTKIVETSKAAPSAAPRECPITITFELAEAQDCGSSPSPPEPFRAVDPQNLIVYGRAFMLCDPSVTVTRTCRRFLFFKKCSKPTYKTNE